MATTVTPKSLKAKATVFNSTKSGVVQDAIDEAERWLNEPNWGASHYNDGVLYLACHILTEDAVRNAAPTPAASASAGAAGPKTSERTLSWAAAWKSATVFDNDPFSTTSWGRTFIARRNLVFSVRSL